MVQKKIILDGSMEMQEGMKNDRKIWIGIDRCISVPIYDKENIVLYDLKYMAMA